MKLFVKNKSTRLLGVGIGSVVLAGILGLLGYDIQRVVAAVPYFLLFLVLIIGPIVRIWPSIPKRIGPGFPLNWRSELGIWFAVWSVVHLLFVFGAREWDVIGYLIDMSPWAFGALIAVIIAVVLAFTSNKKALNWMGVDAWKWHQSHGTYVIFWLVAVHIYDRAYLRPLEEVGFPPTDPLHRIYIIMTLAIIILQLSAFIRIISLYRKTGEYPEKL